MMVRLKIFRFDPQKNENPYYQTFDVEATLRIGFWIASTESAGNRTPAFLSECPAPMASVDRTA